MPTPFDFYDDIETESTVALTEDQFARIRQRFDERFFTITCLDSLFSTAFYDRRTGQRIGGSCTIPGIPPGWRNRGLV